MKFKKQKKSGLAAYWMGVPRGIRRMIIIGLIILAILLIFPWWVLALAALGTFVGITLTGADIDIIDIDFDFFGD